MAIRGSMMSVREDIRILDATLRDGGLVNNFEFTDEFVRALYEMNVAAGVDYMEMGYRASKRQFKESEFGKWKFATDDDIYKIVGDKITLTTKVSDKEQTSTYDFSETDTGFLPIISEICHKYIIPFGKVLHRNSDNTVNTEQN